MQLTFLILVLCCYIQNSTTNSPPYGPTWRRSRYIIDNRRNALFSKRPTSALLQDPAKEPPAVHRFGQDAFKQTLFPSEPYHKDLSAEASISEPKFYGKYGDNSLKIIKSYKLTGGFDGTSDSYNNGIFDSQRNTSGVLDPQDYIQNENDVDVGSKIVTTTQKPWVPVTAPTSKDPQRDDIRRTNSDLEFGIPTTASYPWEIAKSNQIDNTNEKHVYETRIETVSYHQEVIFNPPKKEDWYGERREARNYEQPEENYEEPERNYEEQENYEQPERNYEQPEKNYEQPEKNYEQPEKNYEQPEKNYEQPEKNYEGMSNGRISDPEDSQNKFGYVVEGSNYRKYRVEERTVDGFIVGEYGVVSHDDGSLRGVRYTADGNTNPKLIYETLIKFLSL